MSEKLKLMSHLVAGYPTDQLSLAAARALVAGGAEIFEIQLPFSDPSADVPSIQGACTEVLERKYRVKDGFNFIKQLHEEFPEIPVYVMSYGSLAYTPGIDSFCKMASESGARGIIVPDLPFDDDEGLTAACRKYNMENVPVASPGMSDERLDKMAHAGFEHIYAALRTGITGTETVVDENILKFIEKASAGGSKIFGVLEMSSGKQCAPLSGHAEAVVAASVFAGIIAENKGNEKALKAALEEKALEFTHS